MHSSLWKMFTLLVCAIKNHLAYVIAHAFYEAVHPRNGETTQKNLIKRIFKQCIDHL